VNSWAHSNNNYQQQGKRKNRSKIRTEQNNCRTDRNTLDIEFYNNITEGKTKNTRNVNDEQFSGYKSPDKSTSKQKMLLKEKGKGTNTLHKPLNQTTTKSGPCNNDSTKENLTLKERKWANNALVETTDPGFKNIREYYTRNT
jgi:hypothetical protein